MKNSTKSHVELVNELPPEYQEEVKDFVISLLEKKKQKALNRHLKLSWRGALKDLKEKGTTKVSEEEQL
ncbi:MAG: DUF2281 domain-containing protein, partial [bacterium]